jgi:hypothetical protein
MKRNWFVCAAMILCLARIHAAETTELSADDKKKAEALIKDLGSDEFQTREAAEKGLATLGGNVLPLVKKTAADTSDAEIRTRCERIIKILALEVEKNPDELARIAKELAGSKKYADAAKYYLKASQIYSEQATQPENEKNKSELQIKAKLAKKRLARAEMLAKAGDANNEDDQQIIMGGGARVVVRVGGAVVTDPDTDGNDW